MNPTEIDDAQWMAYVDGGLDAAGRAQVEAAMAANPALAARVQAQQALRGRLQRGLAAELGEPVPDRLSALLVPAPVLQPAGPAATPPPAAPPWRGAALLGAGLLIGLLGPRLLPGGGADLRIDGRLAQALEQQLVAEAGSAGDWQPRLSFRDAEGRYCRAFSGTGQAGLACKGADARWALQLLLPAEAAASGELRTASSALPPALLAAVDARATGGTLDAEAERKARDSGWK
jgi:hypothetical protein